MGWTMQLLGLSLLSLLQVWQGTQVLGHRWIEPLPPCGQVAAPNPGRNCWNELPVSGTPVSGTRDGSHIQPPRQRLPPCDLVNRRYGTDCWIYPPAASDEAHAVAATVTSETPSESGYGVAGLPPCSRVPHGVAGWNCTNAPLPPCNVHKGLDCAIYPPKATP